MPLKFLCPHCSYEIITGYLQSGDMLRCPSCGNFISVPPDAISTDEPSNIIKYIPTPNDDPISDEKQLPTLPPPEPSEWGLRDVLRAIVVYYLGTIAIAVIVGFICFVAISVAGSGDNFSPSNWAEPYKTYINILEGFIGSILAIWIIYYFVVKKHHNNFFEAVKLENPVAKKALLFFALGLALKCITVLISMYPRIRPIIIINNGADADGIFHYGNFYAVICSVPPLFAAFFEEVIYRGFLFAGLKKSLGQVWAAIIVSILFIVSHGPGIFHDPRRLITLSIFSTAVILIRIRTDSVTNAITFHFASNLLVGIWRWVDHFV
jgi:membrane protease YdiL (CAAX protease family)